MSGKDNEKSVQQDGCVVVRMSDVVAALKSETLVQDYPGWLVLGDCDATYASLDKEGVTGSIGRMFEMQSFAFSLLSQCFMDMDPEAWKVVGAWFARAMKRTEAKELLGSLMRAMKD